MSIPETPRAILASKNSRYVCPKCDGNNFATSSSGTVPSTTLFTKFLSGRTCTYCSWDGDVSFAEMAAVCTAGDYINLLFRLVRKEIAAGKDKNFETAESLILLLYRIHEASKKTGDPKNPWGTERFLARLCEAFAKLRTLRKDVFDEEMASAEEATKHALADLASRTAEGCDLRRATRDAQRAIEEYFDQPY